MSLQATPGGIGGAALAEVVIPIVGAAVSFQPWDAGGWLLGWALTEASGAATALIRFVDGPAAGGGLLALIPLAINGMSIVRPGVGGWLIGSSLTLDILAGEVSGSIVIGVPVP